jgi:hypothetical protein
MSTGSTVDSSVRLAHPNQAEALGGGAHRGQVGDVGRDGLLEQAGTQEVEREVAGARADLETTDQRLRALAESLAQLAHHLHAPLRPVVDAPLRVVAVSRQVVIADVGVQDLMLRLLEHCGGG